ncbi:hypothetical protein FG379_000048 [Cryptosporidium bovis]|uniref:uncharacterized protein n=1 Tax=Cryptosporidium bovis TaxID=310047 RepID=UPI00351A0BE4|nr:hypothetical protein FG379_000048 [Cryptosporidium bovis]
MGRKRRYGSMAQEEVAPSSPFLESINLPDENYYRNMTESPMELLQPHMSTNPIKHGVNKTNMNNMLVMQDKFNNMENRIISKGNNRRTLIPQDIDGVYDMRDRNRGTYRVDNIDIINDDMSFREVPGYNTRSRTRAVPKENIYRENEKVLRRRIQKGSSNLPPLPRTEDFWPKINRDGIQDHENYLNSIRNKHFNKGKTNDNCYVIDSSVGNDEICNKGSFTYNMSNLNAYSVDEGIESMHTPLKDLRSGVQRPLNSKKPGITESSISTNKNIDTSNNEHHNSQNNMSRNNVTYRRKNVCNALVGGDTPLRKFGFREFFGDEVETNDIGVGPSPKIMDKINEEKVEVEKKYDSNDISRKKGGSILRKSIDTANESLKQVRFSAEKGNHTVKEDIIPAIKELRFDPSEVPLIENCGNNSDHLTDSIELDDDKMLDTLSVDNNIALRLVQLSKEEIRLFQEGLEDEKNCKDVAMDKGLMIKAISGIHRYFLNKVFEYEGKKDLQFQDIKRSIPDMKYYYESKSQTINSEREELINKIALLNMNINRLTVALREVDEIKSRLLPTSDNEFSADGGGECEYVLKITNKILEKKLKLNNSESHVDLYKNNDIVSPTSSADTEIIPYKYDIGNNMDRNIEELLNECHQSQFMQMESIAVLNDCMSLLDDAEVGMQNFQRLLAKKAFYTNEDDTANYNTSVSDSLEVVEDTLLRLQKGVSITPRFSLDDTISYRNSISSRRSIGSIINSGGIKNLTGK